MNVGELIEKLQEFDKSLPVSVYFNEDGFYVNDVVVEKRDDENTWLGRRDDYPFEEGNWGNPDHDEIVTIGGGWYFREWVRMNTERISVDKQLDDLLQ